jgi:hypothetical protein
MADVPSQRKAGTVRIGLTIPEELMERAKALAEKMNAENPGLAADAYTAIRTTLAKHLPPLPTAKTSPSKAKRG